MDFPFGQDEQGNPLPDPDPANILGPNPDEGWPKDEHPQQGNRQVVGGFLEDLPDLDDLDAHLRDPGSFALSIDFHASFEGILPPLASPNGSANQGLGPTVLPETEQAKNNSNDLAYGPGNGHAAMEQFYTDDEGRLWFLNSQDYDSNGQLIATYRYIDDNGDQWTRQQIVPLIPSEQTFGQDNDRHDDPMVQQNQDLMHSQGFSQGSPSYVPVGPPVEDYYGGQHGGSTSQGLYDSLAPKASRLTAESPSGSAYRSVYSPRSTSANSEPGANSTPQPTMDQAVPVLVMDERSVNRPRDAFPIIFDKALKLGLRKLLDAGGVSFRIATMCSGTDGPILALREFVEAATACGYPGLLQCNHVFSVEIEPFKQAFIRRNAAPSGPIFRNVVDVGMPGATQAMTASGAMADIPLGIDILIAGSSCVDFSSLNYAKNDKKKNSGLNKLFERFKDRGISAIQQDDPMASQVVDGLQQIFESIKDEKGESTRTFLSILMYTHAHRPKIVILENVTRAPWDQFRDFWLPSIGYVAGYVQVDSKNFLVPQTRQRKYLLGVDARYYGNKAEEIVNTWVKLMDITQWFKNPPDLQKFLLPPSDPRVLQTRFQLERTLLSKPKRDVEAVHCAADHRLARRKEELGTSNPYTRMDDRGNVQPREDTWQGIISVYTWRMQDLLDIEYLRAQKKGYDFTHKMFILDVGQNVDRQSGRLGVIPCVLPSADLFISYDGRPLLGLECLAVQGIPVDRISLSVEGENQLKDLAGNAMTTTVAGAAILCALIAEFRFKTKASNRHLQGLAQATPLLPSSVVHQTSTDEAGPSNLLDSFLTLDLSSLGRKTHTSASRKGKEIDRSFSASQTTPNKMAWQEIVSSGWDGNRSVEFFCTLCLNGCRKCRCDAFRKHQHTGVYLRCKDCNETRCQSCAGNPDHNFDRANPIDDEVSIGRSLAQELAIAALPAHLYIDWAGTDTAHSVDILHELDKQIFSDHLEALHRAIQTCAGGVHYYQTDLKFRDDLTVTYESEKSIIVVVITGKDVTWSMHLRPVYIEFGRPSIRNDTSASEKLFVQCEINVDLVQERANDGRMNGFTQKLIEVNGLAPYLVNEITNVINGDYHFTDKCATPLGLLFTKHDPLSPVYMMLQTNCNGAAETDRWVLTKNPRKLEPDQVRDIICVFPKGFKHQEGQPPGSILSAVLPGVYTSLPSALGITVHERDPALHVGLKDLQEQAIMNIDCQSSIPSIMIKMDKTDMHFPVKSLLTQLTPPSGTNSMAASSDIWFTIAQHDIKDALALASSAINKLPASVCAGLLTVSDIVLDSGDACYKCSPTAPKALHHWDADGSVVRIENEAVATQAEQAMLRRPAPLEIQARLELSEADEYNVLSMRILLNPASLAHRAHGYFPVDKDIMSPMVRSTRGSGNFRVETSYHEPSLKGLPPFKDSMVAVQADSYPPQGVFRTPRFLQNGMMLRQDQVEACQWMLHREQDEPFTEREFEERVLPSVNVRLSAVAELENYARGGVLAHDIGYGKTIVTLGLVDHTTTRSHAEFSILERSKWLGTTAFIHIKATLVIVPPHIVSQWAKEAKRFVRQLRVLVLTKTTDISRESMEAADIIIVSSTLMSSEKNIDKLAAIAQMPSIRQKRSNRDSQDWHYEVVETIKHAAYDHSNPDNPNNAHVVARIQGRRTISNDWVRKAAADIVGASDRKTQQTAKATPKKKKGKAAKPKTAVTIDVKEAFQNGEVLEMYTYRRVVFDEFSYENTSVATFFQNAVASSKWILSGTPPTINLGQICETGALLNVHVARPTPSMPGFFPNATTGPKVSELTDAETFRSYTEPLSAQLAADRHDQGQQFLLHYLRKNKMEIPGVEITEAACFTPMNTQEALVYNLVQQVLHDAKWDVDGMPCGLDTFLRTILNEEMTQRAGSKAKAAGKSIWSDAVDALVLLSSLSVSSGRKGFEGMGWTEPNAKLTLERLGNQASAAAGDHLARCTRILVSLFDKMMYLANMICNDADTGSGKAKKDAYFGHMEEIFDFMRNINGDSDDSAFINYLHDAIVYRNSIRPDYIPTRENYWDCNLWSEWMGGPGTYNSAHWWLLDSDHDLSDGELDSLQNRWVGSSGDQSDDREALIDLLRQEQDSQDKREEMALAIGLKDTGDITAQLQKHFDGKATKDDYEFGIQIPAHRPQKGKTIKPRGQAIDETLNSFILVVQSVQAGIKLTTEAWRRCMFLMKLNHVLHGSHSPLSTTCNVCDAVTADSDMFHSIACGHSLCKDCFGAFTEAGGQMCPMQSCKAFSRGSFVPSEIFATPANLQHDLSAVPSAKVSDMENVMFNNVLDDEKVLIFAAYAGIKQEVYDHLIRSDNGFSVYMTDGGDEDSNQIEAFKAHRGKAVLIQSLMSSESAGTNLTEANHLMFAGVLYTDSDSYDMYMRQAKGRLIRYGQKRPVFVYHFITPATLEFDIFNKRHGNRIRHFGEEGRIAIPVTEDGEKDPRFPLYFRPYLETASMEKLLRSVEFEEYEK
ncbi:SNF2 super family protein [Colletotrichum costaricense]|uniref:SNF2 super family protein n=1 Tax=Colletotrichum costaricense TaxID=1209916 RepID=A0AAJ0E2A1_9PEZI|nr:SNF2 super family protein [Colletotrichum costaricense]KAK1531028.1 SNF2 super family protein [Colletotrichum costaricense]